MQKYILYAVEVYRFAQLEYIFLYSGLLICKRQIDFL